MVYEKTFAHLFNHGARVIFWRCKPEWVGAEGQGTFCQMGDQKKKKNWKTTESLRKADNWNPDQNVFIAALSYVNSATSPQCQRRT